MATKCELNSPLRLVWSSVVEHLSSMHEALGSIHPG
jgi:hypothetical protein